jgi:hypothetical protein
VIPTYDNARTLEDVVRRAAATGLDVLVVDDGSTDGTRALLAPQGALVVQDAEVACGRRPGTGEAAGDVPGAHLAPAEVQDEQDLARRP